MDGILDSWMDLILTGWMDSLSHLANLTLLLQALVFFIVSLLLELFPHYLQLLVVLLQLSEFLFESCDLFPAFGRFSLDPTQSCLPR